MLGSAAGLALVLFSSGMLSARSFAAKGRYEIDADRELAAFGAANLASAVSQGFAVTGADSRTAIGDASGGRTQVTGLVAAAAIALVLLFLTGPLQYVPIAALGGIADLCLAVAVQHPNAAGVLAHRPRRGWPRHRHDAGRRRARRHRWHRDRGGSRAVRFVQATARPKDEILGTVEGFAGLHAIERHQAAKTFPGMVLYRFNAPLTFFNSDYFRTRAMAVAAEAGPELKWFMIDTIPISRIDLTGLYALRDLRERLEAQGTVLVLAGRRTELLNWFREAGLYRLEHESWISRRCDRP